MSMPNIMMILYNDMKAGKITESERSYLLKVSDDIFIAETKDHQAAVNIINLRYPTKLKMNIYNQQKNMNISRLRRLNKHKILF